jgi:hypothetical protein
MERKHFIYVVQSEVTATKQELEEIAKVAKSHYDYKCKQMGKTVESWIRFMEGDTETRTLDTNDVSLIVKILEQEHYSGVKQYDQWYALLRSMLDEYERVNVDSMLASDTWNARYKAELRRKYKTTTPS